MSERVCDEMFPCGLVATLTAERDKWKSMFESAQDEQGRDWAKDAALAISMLDVVAERDQLLEDIKERDRTYLAVQKAEGLEREKVELQRDALRTALEAAAGMFNEMHPHTQGHMAENCTRRTDFCGVAMVVREALGGKS